MSQTSVCRTRSNPATNEATPSLKVKKKKLSSGPAKAPATAPARFPATGSAPTTGTAFRDLTELQGQQVCVVFPDVHYHMVNLLVLVSGWPENGRELMLDNRKAR